MLASTDRITLSYLTILSCTFSSSPEFKILLLSVAIDRPFFTGSSKIQKARISRNPKTGEKVNTPAKKTIHFKMSKEMFKKINDE